MLGSSIYPFFKNKGYDVLATDINVNEPWIEYLDVRDFNKINELTKKFNPDLIFHLAALTNLEYCENNMEDANNTNFIATRNIAKLCKGLDIPLVYISTAGVFDGTKKIYSEEDIPNPINVYGKTKYYGEIAVENILKKYFIVRAGWMIGGGRKDKKFVSYILKQISEGKREFNVVSDSGGTPTYTKDFAKNLELLINTNFYGKYHMACLGWANRVEIAKEILETINIKEAKINEVTSDFFKKDFPVIRAASERMINLNLTKKNINIMRDWREALKDYLVTEWSDLFKSEKDIKNHAFKYF